MIKNIYFLPLLFIFWCSLSINSVAAGALTTNGRYEDILQDLSSFTVTGEIQHRSGNLLQPGEATLSVRQVARSTIAPSNFATSSTFGYTVDFSLQNFSSGDSFDFRYNSWPNYIADTYGNSEILRCQVVGSTFNCNVYLEAITAERVVEQPYQLRSRSQPADLFASGRIMTLAVTRTREGTSFRLWQKNAPEQGVLWLDDSNLLIVGTDPVPSIIPPVLSLRQDHVQSSAAQFTLRGFYSIDPQRDNNAQMFYFDQTDPSWSSERLGHSTSTIGQAGCFLASMAMTLQSLGCHNLPSGDVVNPSTLNQWLKSRSDGYINGNLLNPIALTVLAKQVFAAITMTRDNPQPKFEYTAISTTAAQANYYGIIAEVLNRGHMLVAEIPGRLQHFVAIKGVNHAGHTVVADPYKQELATIDPILRTAVRSYRRFVPSFTDLSYLVVNVIGQAAVELTPSDPQAEIVTLELYEPGTEWQIGTQYLLAKPESGDYALTVTPQSSHAAYSLMAYNQEGEVIIHADEQTPITEPIAIDFFYDKHAPTDFLQLDDGQELSPSEKWQRFFALAWPYQFARLTLQHLYQINDLPLLRIYADDFFARQLLPLELYQQLQELLSANATQ